MPCNSAVRTALHVIHSAVLLWTIHTLCALSVHGKSANLDSQSCQYARAGCNQLSAMRQVLADYYSTLHSVWYERIENHSVIGQG